MLKFLLLCLTTTTLLYGCGNLAPPTLGRSSSPVVAPTVGSATLPLDDYATVLRTYVNAEGLVNYVGLQANPQLLNEFVAKLGTVSPETYAAWSEPEKIAFLINAYNAITLQSIIEQRPLKNSIKDIFGVWNFKTHQVLGAAKTLDHLEHQILRREFNEPRIHAALVCAAISCPPLRPEPYTGEKLDEQLEDQVRQWIAGSHGIRIDRVANQVSISAIFKWFGEDWQKNYGIDGKFVGNGKERAVLNFISNYVSPEDRAYLEQSQYKLDYLNYDWSLNRQS